MKKNESVGILTVIIVSFLLVSCGEKNSSQNNQPNVDSTRSNISQKNQPDVGSIPSGESNSTKQRTPDQNSVHPPRDLVNKVTNFLQDGCRRLNQECKDFRVSQSKKMELTPAELENDVAEQWRFRVTYIYRVQVQGENSEWDDSCQQFDFNIFEDGKLERFFTNPWDDPSCNRNVW